MSVQEYAQDTTTAQSSPAAFVAALDRASTRRTTPSGAGEMVWRIWGSGYPLVLIHGGSGSWMHWVRNIEDLSRDFMLVLPDIPGSGESASPTPVTAERIGVTMREGLKAIIGPDTPFAVAGFSLGGLMSGYLAQAAGAAAQTLVLVGSAGTDLPRGPKLPLQSWRRLPTEEEKRAVHRTNLGLLMLHDPRKIDDLAVYIQTTNSEVSRVRGKHVSHTGSLAQALPGFPGRLAGIWGEHDATSVPYLAERGAFLRSLQPGASFDVVPDVGHWVQYEAHETFNKRLRELVKPTA